MTKGWKVDDEDREIAFTNGTRRTFHHVTKIDVFSCEWFRIYCEDGIVILNPDKVNYIIAIPKNKQKQKEKII